LNIGYPLLTDGKSLFGLFVNIKKKEKVV